MSAKAGVDKWIFFVTVLLIVIGLAMVFSASAVVARERSTSEFLFVGKQAVWALCGVGALLILMGVETDRFNRRGLILTAVALCTALLVAVYFFPASHNTHRWIRLGGYFGFQPSEIAKPVLVLFLAWFLSQRLETINDFRKTLLPGAAVPAAFILLVALQPDLGTAMVLAGTAALMLLLAGVRWRILFGVLGAMLPPSAAMLYFVAWRWKRVWVFLHPDSDTKGAGFHIYQSLIAVGSGGITGRGFMEGVQKLFFLPEASTDFIYANLAEETGLIGSLFVLLLFAAFGFRGMRAVLRAKDPFTRLVAFGITAMLVLQAFFNISVVLALLPTKGIPLPLISAGGTSIFCTLASIGILLKITRNTE